MFNDWSKRMPTFYKIGKAGPPNEVKNDVMVQAATK